MAHPREIANAILWLASDEASFATGAMFTVDGGHDGVGDEEGAAAGGSKPLNDLTADVLIIGAGIIGLCCAHALLNDGRPRYHSRPRPRR